jgi:hypothetical protein
VDRNNCICACPVSRDPPHIRIAPKTARQTFKRTGSLVQNDVCGGKIGYFGVSMKRDCSHKHFDPGVSSLPWQILSTPKNPPAQTNARDFSAALVENPIRSMVSRLRRITRKNLHPVWYQHLLIEQNPLSEDNSLLEFATYHSISF